ncbi:MAG: hypothetical protein B6242_16385 [Anaerolineaceae bacterium 4572_78]|nr:MAG: hypothetical protein B6242_16385 [Anaerolineaceae bacterium 4572_78]
MQSKSKNDGVQLSTRYWTYTVAKRHLRGQSGGQVFPIRETNESDIQQGKELQMQSCNCLRTNYSSGFSNETYVQESGPFTQTHDWRIRRLTPTECERLQGFPDGWTEEGLTKVQFYGNIPFNNRRYICDKNAELKDAIENLCQGKRESALCTIKGLSGEEQQIRVSRQKKNANIVGEMQLQEISALDITNLGNDMVTLCNLKGTYSTAEQIKKNLTQERTEKKSILPLWKIYLEESYNKERLSTILTWIKETTKNQIFTYPQTGEPITNVIIHWNWSQPNFIKEESFNLKTANIVSVSDTQRYKCLGNAVTTNVITAIGERLLEIWD